MNSPIYHRLEKLVPLIKKRGIVSVSNDDSLTNIDLVLVEFLARFNQFEGSDQAISTLKKRNFKDTKLLKKYSIGSNTTKHDTEK